jgi:hypothetical protein
MRASTVYYYGYGIGPDDVDAIDVEILEDGNRELYVGY